MNYLTCLVGCMTLAGSGEALAVGALADVRIVDRDSGAALPVHYYRGEYWVAGNPGARYAIRICNRSGARVLAVTAVDGVNVISGATANWNQAGYVFAPGEQYEISGWRKSDTEVAVFTFTAAADSYAGRTGREANAGIVGVALFRERPAVTWYAPHMASPAEQASPPARSGESRAGSADKASGGIAGLSTGTAGAPSAAEKLGTGHGAREYSSVQQTEFARQQTDPNEVVRIRYDSLDNLIAMGIVPRPRLMPSALDPFPASPAAQYVPDPPG